MTPVTLKVRVAGRHISGEDIILLDLISAGDIPLPPFEAGAHNEEIGSVLSDKKSLKVAVSDGFISILSLQMPAKKRMSVKELLNGQTFSSETKAL